MEKLTKNFILGRRTLLLPGSGDRAGWSKIPQETRLRRAVLPNPEVKIDHECAQRLKLGSTK